MACADALAARNACKAALGLAPNGCYPTARYDGRCGEVEDALRRCLALASCGDSARVVYDPTAPRAARVKANAALQLCLQAKHAAELGCDGPPPAVRGGLQ